MLILWHYVYFVYFVHFVHFIFAPYVNDKQQQINHWSRLHWHRPRFERESSGQLEPTPTSRPPDELVFSRSTLGHDTEQEQGLNVAPAPYNPTNQYLHIYIYILEF